MFIESTWYVAAEPEELVNGMCSRKILGTQVVMFKTEGGSIAALEDRCPHRYAPLSRGLVDGETIRCGYHGACFDTEGQIVSVPGQDDIQSSQVIRTFPVVEKYGYIWIWMGERDKADQGESIPEGFYIGDDPEWAGRKQKILSLSGYYELINDNLFDLTHAEWVHGSTLGSDILRLTRKMRPGLPGKDFNGGYYDLKGKTVKFGLHSNDCTAPPAFSKGLGLKYGKDDWTDNADVHIDVEWWCPSSFVFDVKTKPAGAEFERGVRQVSLNALTPETETSTHYFFTVSHNYDLDDESVTDYWTKGVSHVFAEGV